GDAGRRGLRPDGAGAGGAGGGLRVGPERDAVGGVPHRAHRGAVLQDRQFLANAGARQLSVALRRGVGRLQRGRAGTDRDPQAFHSTPLVVAGQPACRCRTASNSATPAATDTLRLSTSPSPAPGIEMAARLSQFSRVSLRSPSPSPPTTRPTLPRRSSA